MLIYHVAMTPEGHLVTRQPQYRIARLLVQLHSETMFRAPVHQVSEMPTNPYITIAASSGYTYVLTPSVTPGHFACLTRIRQMQADRRFQRQHKNIFALVRNHFSYTLVRRLPYDAR